MTPQRLSRQGGTRRAALAALLVPVILLVVACRQAPRVEMLAPPTDSGQSADPAVAVDPGTGDLLLSWVAGDSSDWHVYFARSPDGGATWSEPRRVTDRAHDVHPHGESSPRLVAAAGVVAVAWTNSVPATGRKWPASNIRFSRSADGGRTWSRAVTLNDDTAAGPAGHIFHGATWSGDSGIAVAWMDERGGAAPGNTGAESHLGHHAEAAEESDATVYLAHSSDLGSTWPPNRRRVRAAA
jgi:Neuraminidase (sialidase)